MDASSEHLPYLIWEPLKPRPETLAELARRRPEMLLPVAHACTAADYEQEFDALVVALDPFLLAEARRCSNKHHLSHPNPDVAVAPARPGSGEAAGMRKTPPPTY